MRRKWVKGLGLLLAATLLAGCNNNLKDENALLTEENQNLRAQLADRNSALEFANDEIREKDLRIASLTRDLEAGQARPAANVDPFSGIAGVSGSVSAGEVTATLENDLFFDSGQASLKAASQRSLDAVAGILNSSYRGRSIRVAGHTDTDPIRKSGFKSNYHLGFERAYAVRDYLISRGVSADRIYIASHGPDRPRGSKNESRRVEIVVVLNES